MHVKRYGFWVCALLLTLSTLNLIAPVQPVSANPTIIGQWRDTYPESTSDDAQCRLCHFNPSGGDGWNAYGWSIRQQIYDNGLTAEEAFPAVEALDADGNGITNLVEISANALPGWTSGTVNTIYFKDGTTQENQEAPSTIGLLDPVQNGLQDPITATITSTGALEIVLTELVTDIVSPLSGTATPALPQFLFVVDQPGFVWKIDVTSGAKSLFLDASASLVPLGVFGTNSFDERGLLGFAFHPDYAANGLVYTYSSEPITTTAPFTVTADYSTMPAGQTANHHAVISQWTVNDPTNADSVVDTASKKVLLRIDEPQFNHNGGHLAFGPDNMLYIALGDGGGADDADGQQFIDTTIVGHGATGNGQDATNPLGTILRINPLGSNSPNGQYGIPDDNPFVGAGDTRLDEIFAYGFRNPFRFSFDRQTGDLYAGDVGQNDIEEINLVTAGGNYGWNHKEGSFFFDPNGNESGFVTDVDPGGLPTDLIDPVAEYDHDEGLSVIGGYVYRGSQVATLSGLYIFGDWSLDFASPPGRLFYLAADNEIKEFRLLGRDALGIFLHGFGQDANGELYVLGNTTGTPFGTEAGVNTGVVFKIRGATPQFLPLILIAE